MRRESDTQTIQVDLKGRWNASWRSTPNLHKIPIIMGCFKLPDQDRVHKRNTIPVLKFKLSFVVLLQFNILSLSWRSDCYCPHPCHFSVSPRIIMAGVAAPLAPLAQHIPGLTVCILEGKFFWWRFLLILICLDSQKLK